MRDSRTTKGIKRVDGHPLAEQHKGVFTLNESKRQDLMMETP